MYVKFLDLKGGKILRESLMPFTRAWRLYGRAESANEPTDGHAVLYERLLKIV